MFGLSAVNGARRDSENPLLVKYIATTAHSQSVCPQKTECVSESRCVQVCVCVLVSHPSSVSLMMSQISMLSVQSSFCREPSVAFSVRNKPHTLISRPSQLLTQTNTRKTKHLILVAQHSVTN